MLRNRQNMLKAKSTVRVMFHDMRN